MSETLVWWLMMQVVGLAALPLCLLLFRRLPDRGYTLSKAFALLLVGYWFWILNVIHILPNTAGGIWIVVFVLIAISAVVYWLRREELLAFARERWWLIVAAEVIFFLAFITAAYLRSYVADLGGTEKPMDFMFLNAVTRGKHFPPPDPWLAGQNVSYYYFGYLLVSVVTRLSALDTSVGFNLGLSMIVALAVVGVFGLVYNLAAPQERRAAEVGPGTPAAGFDTSQVLWRPIIFAAIAALLLTVIGNLEGLLEALAAHDFGPMAFWKWANIDHGDLLVPYKSTHWYPDHFFFWWRATRILDNGVGIHEFPYFSFLLGDLHPHVMAIPFVLLALGVAQVFLRSDGPLDLVVWLERPFALVAFAIVVGGLAFLNTWDMPTMAFVVGLAALIRNRLLAERWSWGIVLDTAGFIVPLYLCAALAYAPFFFGGFTSQASGFKAVYTPGTGLFHLMLLWGPFAVLVLPYAVWRIRQSDAPITRDAILWCLAPAALVILVWLFWDVLAKVFGALPHTLQLNEARDGANKIHYIGTRMKDRGWNWLTALLLSGCIGVLVLALWREIEDAKRSVEERIPHIFALTLGTTAALLILGAEFIYIKDSFDSRMNTIFKLYYQAWIMLSVAGGFALYQLGRDWQVPRVRGAESGSMQLNLAGWSPGEFGVAASTLAGVIIGAMLPGDAFTRVIGMIVGGGIFFGVSGAGVLLWRGSVMWAGKARPLREGSVDFLDPLGAWPLYSGLVRSLWPLSAIFLLLTLPFLLYSVSLALVLRLGPERTSDEAGPRPLSWRAVWAAAAVAVLAAAFVYPVMAAYNRTNGFTGHRTLDGMATTSGDQRDAIKWLNGLDGSPVIAEATGDDYRIETGGLFSAATGLPTILQWIGHELQWRGSTQGLDARKDDTQKLYESASQDEVKSLLQKYNVRYVIVGPAEHDKYPNIHVDQMSDLVTQVFQEGNVTMYLVSPDILSQARSSP